MTAVAETRILPTYARQDVTFTRGEGAWVEDADGNRYLDFLAGIAVVGLGHCHPAVTAAAHAQLDRLWHASNLYWTEPMLELAERLSARFGGAQAFFCNSGAEAIEAGLKYARKASGKPGIVALENSFHGRTLGALSVTGQPSKQAGFGPLLPDVRFARLNDAESLAAACADGDGRLHPRRADPGRGRDQPRDREVPRVGRRGGGGRRCDSPLRRGAVRRRQDRDLLRPRAARRQARRGRARQGARERPADRRAPRVGRCAARPLAR